MPSLVAENVYPAANNTSYLAVMAAQDLLATHLCWWG